MECFRNLYSLLVLVGVHLMYAVNGTTVVPLCQPSESSENCTTAMVQTTHSPKPVPMKIGKCQMEMESFCWNGQCMYLVDLDEHYCRCEKGYTGIRCSHAELIYQPMNQEYLAITLFLSSLLLLAVVVAAFFAYKWYKTKKAELPHNEYKEVSIQNL
ncbi:hypothetical protein XENTR_v10001009 [Xenopus tropicalis]|uniref:Proepiregulin n=1 Tax=Xenopus tropicalis TaxID=8364 RepID=Q28BU9_XENTR|nr:proepiregulin precursor [Xenopus tropicalis]KAE8630896.1 hypothetical protein XENTR_v10001009 [Xenopus tropicalis]CAJ83368.1 epiregulin [Xenopus tropicalis]|eukprot:NP_001039160.1 proepiregulin precursor [Xenopus tropicalis]